MPYINAQPGIKEFPQASCSFARLAGSCPSQADLCMLHVDGAGFGIECHSSLRGRVLCIFRVLNRLTEIAATRDRRKAKCGHVDTCLSVVQVKLCLQQAKLALKAIKVRRLAPAAVLLCVNGDLYPASKFCVVTL